MNKLNQTRAFTSCLRLMVQYVFELELEFSIYKSDLWCLSLDFSHFLGLLLLFKRFGIAIIELAASFNQNETLKLKPFTNLMQKRKNILLIAYQNVFDVCHVSLASWEKCRCDL